MHADQLLRALQRRANGGHGDRGGVGRQDGVCGNNVFQLGKQLALDVQVLDDGFHHQGSIGKFLVAGGRQQACAGGFCLFRAHAAFVGQFAEHLANVGDRLFGGTLARIQQTYGVAGLGRHLGNAGTHGTSTNHGYHAGSGQCLAHVQAPVKRGARFSRKADTPST